MMMGETMTDEPWRGAPSKSQRMDELRATLARTQGKPLRERLAGFEDLFDVLFRGMNLQGEDLSGQDLRNMNFTGTNLIGARFDGALIEGAQFWQAWVTRAQLQQSADWPAFAANWSAPDGRTTAGSMPEDRVLLDPCAPDFVVLKPPVHGAERPDGIEERNWEAWREGRLAMSRAPLTVWEAQRANAIPENEDLLDGHRPALFAPDVAHRYVEWLQARIGGSVRIPSHALWHAIAQMGEIPTLPHPDHVVTRDSVSNQSAPEPAPQDNSRRANALGLVDMIGNVPEFCFSSEGLLVVAGGGVTEDLSECRLRVEKPSVPDRATGRHLAGVRLVFCFRGRGAAGVGA